MSQESWGAGETAATFSETLPPSGHGPHLECHISENTYWTNTLGFPGGASGKQSAVACQCRSHERHRFNPWVRKISWSRKWHPTPVFLPRKFHGQRSPAGYSPWDYRKSDTTERTKTLGTKTLAGGESRNGGGVNFQEPGECLDL